MKGVGGRRKLWLCLALGLALTGCDMVPASGPEMNGVVPGNSHVLPFDVVDLNVETVAVLRQQQLATAAAMAPKAVARPGPPRITAASGDVLRVRIFEPYDGSIYAPLQKGGSEVGLLRVSERGTITVPYAGTVSVTGLDLQAIEVRIVAQLTGKAFQPQVVVELAADRSNTVLVSGDVRAPGRYSMLEGTRTVLDAINRAGGAAKPPIHEEVVVKRRGGDIRMAMSDLMSGGDFALQRDDTVIVSPAVKFITALGAVNKSGNVELPRSDMSLLEALGDVGGLTDQRANKTGVYIFRPADSPAFTTPTGAPGLGVPATGGASAPKPLIYRLDFSLPVSVFVAQQFVMQPRDVVYVSNAPLYEADKVLTVVNRMFNLFYLGSVTRTTIVATP